MVQVHEAKKIEETAQAQQEPVQALPESVAETAGDETNVAPEPTQEASQEPVAEEPVPAKGKRAKKAATKPEGDAPAPKPKSKKKRVPSTGSTLGALKGAYIAGLVEDGKSGGTVASYAAEVDLALSILGAETALADLTPKQVQRFFNHDRVVKLRSGREKSQLSIDKSRRVFRQALEFAAANGWIPEAPLPKAEARK